MQKVFKVCPIVSKIILFNDKITLWPSHLVRISSNMFLHVTRLVLEFRFLQMNHELEKQPNNLSLVWKRDCCTINTDET